MDRVHVGKMRDGDRSVVVGICGLIGSGKSVVSRLLRLKGIPVYDCDAEARRIMDNDRHIHTALQAIAGDDVIVWDVGCQSIDRNRLAERMFSDKEILSGVNALVHARVREDFATWVSDHKAVPVVGVECAIMATSSMASLCDVLWTVVADEKIREQRVMMRNATTSERVRQWMAAQRQEQLALHSLIAEGRIPVVQIDNNGDTSLLEQTDVALKLID